MEMYDDDTFSFGSYSNDESENSTGFNYDSISGLGESDYENEDLFNSEVEQPQESNSSDLAIENQDEKNDSKEFTNSDYIESIIPTSNSDYGLNATPTLDYGYVESIIPTSETYKEIADPIATDEPKEIQESSQDNDEDDIKLESPDVYEFPKEEIELQPIDNKGEEDPVVNVEENEDRVDKETNSNNEESENDNKEIFDTSEDLNKLTEYKDEKIESTDINGLFDKVSVNVKDASDIFKRNTDLKQKIDARFEELKKLQSEIENSKKSQKDEIDRYKEEVYNKLTEKKEEIEKRLNVLRETQTNLEKERNEFEQYRKKEKENIDRVQKEVQAAYDDRREELSNIEDILRKQKDALDEERNQLSLDKIQYEADKNELANNLLKFNDLVNSFTNGVETIKE